MKKIFLVIVVAILMLSGCGEKNLTENEKKLKDIASSIYDSTNSFLEGELSKDELYEVLDTASDKLLYDNDYLKDPTSSETIDAVSISNSETKIRLALIPTANEAEIKDALKDLKKYK